LPKFGEKPATVAVKRGKRGLFRTGTFGCINAGCNGAANILRKVKGKFKSNLSGLIRGTMSSAHQN
ncbi:transposase, partial [Phormidium pseudopriestleyi FRX01]|nr:transposase [Phormidium pseudopriestleyi FRX01]